MEIVCDVVNCKIDEKFIVNCNKLCEIYATHVLLLRLRRKLDDKVRCNSAKNLKTRDVKPIV